MTTATEKLKEWRNEKTGDLENFDKEDKDSNPDTHSKKKTIELVMEHSKNRLATKNGYLRNNGGKNKRKTKIGYTELGDDRRLRKERDPQTREVAKRQITARKRHTQLL